VREHKRIPVCAAASDSGARLTAGPPQIDIYDVLFKVLKREVHVGAGNLIENNAATLIQLPQPNPVLLRMSARSRAMLISRHIRLPARAFAESSLP